LNLFEVPFHGPLRSLCPLTFKPRRASPTRKERPTRERLKVVAEKHGVDLDRLEAILGELDESG